MDDGDSVMETCEGMRRNPAMVVSQILRAEAMGLAALYPGDPAAEYGARVLEHVAGILSGWREI